MRTHICCTTTRPVSGNYILVRRLVGDLLVQQFLCLVDLCRQVRTTASIGVVEQHVRPVGFADLVLGEGTLAVALSVPDAVS